MSKADRLQELDGMIAKLEARIRAYDGMQTRFLSDVQKEANAVAVSELRHVLQDTEDRREYVATTYKD